jgi:WD40 repeat protein
MNMRPNKIEPDELDLLLNEAERGVAGKLLRAVSEEIEPRLEFAQGLESHLLAGGASHPQPEQSNSQRQDVPPGVMGRLNASSDNEGMRKRGRIAPIAFGTLGVAAMILLFVGMAAMLNLRQQKSGIPQPVDSSEAVKHFQLLHTLSLYFSSPPTQDMQMAWSPNGKVIAAAVESGVSFWDGKTGQFLYTVPANKIVTMAFSPDGSLLALGVQGGEREGNGIQLVDPATGRKGHYLRYSTKGTMVSETDVTRIAWAPDSKLLATTAQEVSSYPPPDTAPRSSTTEVVGIIQVWDVSTGKEVQAIRIPGESMGVRSISAIAWSPIGSTIASISIDGALRLWDATTSKMLYHLATNRMYEFAHMVWSPNGSTLAIVADREVHLWDAQSGKLLRKLPELLPDFPKLSSRLPIPDSAYLYISSLVWSPDGKTLATADGGHIRLWDPATGQVEWSVKGSLGDTYSVLWHLLAWSPDGQVLATVGGDDVVMRDATNGEQISTIPFRQARLMAWSAGGNMLALSTGIASTEAQIAIWGVRSEAEPVVTLTATATPTEAAPSPAPTLVEPIAGYATPSMGSPMPDFESVDVRTGQPITVSSLRGKPLVLTFWGVWCPPCRGQMPTLQKGYETYGKDIEFLNVSMGPRDTPEAVMEFINQNGYKGMFTHVGSDSVIYSYNFISAVPAMYFLDKDGIVRAVHVGGMSDSQLEGYLRLLNTVGGVTSPTPYHPAGTATQPAVPGPYPTPVVGSTIPNFESIDVRTGQTITMPSLRGKPLVLTVWNMSLCQRCIEALPMLRKADNVYGRDVQFLNVSVNIATEPRDTPESVKEFITRNGYSWRFSHTDASFTDLHLVAILPTTFFIDSNGVVQAVHVGEMSDLQLDEYIHQLGVTSPLLPTSAPNPTTTPQPAGCDAWSIVDSPNGDSVNDLLSVSAISPDDVWAVGYHSIGSPAYVDGKPVPDLEANLTMHWDGKNWRSVDSPNVGGEKMHNRLTSVSGVSRDDVWAVGYYADRQSLDSSSSSTTLLLKTAIILHWNGSNWSIAHDFSSDSSPSQLNSVAAVSADDVWAVGHRGVDFDPYHPDPATRSETLILHWNGNSWSKVSSPSPGPFFNKLYAVSASSPNDVWAVGVQSYTEVRGGGGGLAPHPLALHWDGKNWSVTPMGNSPSIDDTSGVPLAVAAAAMSEAHAVGGIFGEGASDSITIHWDGAKWAQVDVAVPKPAESAGPPQDHLSGVVALSKDDVWAVGTYIRYGAKPLNDTSPLVMHWNGKEWSYISSPDPRYTLGANGSAIENIGSNSLNAITAAPNGDLWAVGSSSITSPTGVRQSNSLIMRYTAGPCSTPTPKP